MSSKRLCWLVLVLLPALAMAADDSAVVQGSITLGGMTLQFKAPKQVKAYEKAVVNCKLVGQGYACVQVVATDNPAYEQYFDTAIPHRVAYRLDYLSDDGANITFRITNTGNTIWKAGGYGKTRPADFAAPYAYLSADLAPGQSILKTYPRHRMQTNPPGKELRSVLQFQREDTLRRWPPESKVEMLFPADQPGFSQTSSAEFNTVPLHDDFDELGQAFAGRLVERKSIPLSLKVQVPPWADRLVVRLIKDGEIKATSMPLKVSEDSLRLGGKPNARWTLNGKPVFIASNISTEEIPRLREQMGGRNVVLACRRELNSDSPWLKAVRENGFKITPVSIGYVRLQILGDVMGRKLMQGNPPQFNMQRVDALDPDFHEMMADIVDRVYENCKDVLFRTADGKVPICLSEEQSYGFPWASGYPTRWGGGSPEDVAAFRIWLKKKYCSIEKLNSLWKTTYDSFEEIDPSPICSINPPDYPDPWKEWGPAIEDFDVFRSKIHGEFWARTVAEIKRRHPDIICGLNVFGDYASETEPIYKGFFDWGVKDYQGKGVNWMARRTGCLPEDLMCFDYFVCWNTGSPEAAKKNLEFWHKRGKDVVIYATGYSKIVLGGDVDLSSHAALATGKKGFMIDQASPFFPTLKVTYEYGGIPGLLNDAYIGGRMDEMQRREIEIFNKEIACAGTAR